MIQGKKTYLIPVLLVLLTALVYAGSLRIPFVIDDQHIVVRNLLLRQWTLEDILTSHLFAPLGVETQYYRPLTLLSFAVNYSLSGLNPEGYHIVSLALHLLVVALSYLLLSQFVSPWIAGFSAALFAVHPANVQAVSYISSRSDPLYSALIFLSLHFWLKSQERHGVQGISFRLFSLMCFFLGLFAKESAIVLPALIMLTDLSFEAKGRPRHCISRNWLWYSAFFLVLGVYVGVRTGLVGYALTMEASKETWKTGTELGIWNRTLLALQLLALYVGLALYPVKLAFFREVAIPQGPFEFAVLAGVGSLAFMVALGWYFFHRQKAVFYGILWFLITILPVLNLTSLNAPMMEHWLYLPLIGLVLALVSCLHFVGQHLAELRGAAFALALLVTLLSAKTIARNSQWRDPVILFQNDARSYPNHEKNWSLLGYAYFEHGMMDQAIRAYKTSLAVNSKSVHAWSGLGEALSMAGKNEEAERSFMKAISIMPENPWLHYVLGIHRLKTGKIDAAIEALTQSVSLKSPFPMGYHLLGSAYLRQRKRDEAEKAFRKALSMLPQEREIHAAVHIELGKLYMRLGDRDSALEEWQIALQFEPNSREAKALLSSP